MEQPREALPSGQKPRRRPRYGAPVLPVHPGLGRSFHEIAPRFSNGLKARPLVDPGKDRSPELPKRAPQIPTHLLEHRWQRSPELTVRAFREVWQNRFLPLVGHYADVETQRRLEEFGNTLGLAGRIERKALGSRRLDKDGEEHGESFNAGTELRTYTKINPSNGEILGQVTVVAKASDCETRFIRVQAKDKTPEVYEVRAYRELEGENELVTAATSPDPDKRRGFLGERRRPGKFEKRRQWLAEIADFYRIPLEEIPWHASLHEMGARECIFNPQVNEAFSYMLTAFIGGHIPPTTLVSEKGCAVSREKVKSRPNVYLEHYEHDNVDVVSVQEFIRGRGGREALAPPSDEDLNDASGYLAIATQVRSEYPDVSEKHVVAEVRRRWFKLYEARLVQEVVKQGKKMLPENEKLAHFEGAFERIRNLAQGMKEGGIEDWLNGNVDRNRTNMGVDRGTGELVLFDNSLSHSESKLETCSKQVTDSKGKNNEIRITGLQKIHKAFDGTSLNDPFHGFTQTLDMYRKVPNLVLDKHEPMYIRIKHLYEELKPFLLMRKIRLAQEMQRTGNLRAPQEQGFLSSLFNKFKGNDDTMPEPYRAWIKEGSTHITEAEAEAKQKELEANHKPIAAFMAMFKLKYGHEEIAREELCEYILKLGYIVHHRRPPASFQEETTWFAQDPSYIPVRIEM